MLSLFLTHLEGYKKDAIKSPILIILEVICELLLPLVMAEIVDVAIPSGDVGYIFAMGGLMLVLAVLAMAWAPPNTPPSPARALAAICANACLIRCRTSPSPTSTAFPPPPLSPA